MTDSLCKIDFIGLFFGSLFFGPIMGRFLGMKITENLTLGIAWEYLVTTLSPVLFLVSFFFDPCDA